mmetsp:Transcript_31527/g.57287  ORF Transcript_31527/g.57287 Transcript_31527/m.57287 type:complete len:122 (+) Transcript_31527:1-366(+)
MIHKFSEDARSGSSIKMNTKSQSAQRANAGRAGLVLWRPLLELDDDTRHVISSQSLSLLWVRTETRFEEALNGFRKRNIRKYAPSEITANFLRCLDIPNPVTRQDDEFIILLQINTLNVRC